MYLSLRSCSAGTKPASAGFEAKRNEAFQVEMPESAELQISVSHLKVSTTLNHMGVDFQIAEGVEVVLRTPTMIKLRLAEGQSEGKFCLIADGVNVSGLLKAAEHVRFRLPLA